jgi:hypothetical protein
MCRHNGLRPWWQWLLVHVWRRCKPVYLQKALLPLSVFLARLGPCLGSLGAPLWLLADAAKVCAEMPDTIRHGAWAIHHLRGVENGVSIPESGKLMIFGAPHRG